MVVSSNKQVPGRMMYTPLIIKETQYIIPLQSLELVVDKHMSLNH